MGLVWLPVSSTPEGASGFQDSDAPPPLGKWRGVEREEGGVKSQNLHPWRVDTAKARQIQERLRGRVRAQWGGRPVRLVAGADVSFPRRDAALAVVVVMSFPRLDLIETAVRRGRCTFPYIPGLLSFREVPVLLKAFEVLKHEPDLILFDAQGIAHPRRMGLAAHAGLLLNRPSIGCAKSRLFGRHGEPGQSRGSFQPLIAPEGDVVGAVLRTRSGVRPVFVSVGHRIDLPAAIRFVLETSPRYRIPEPLRVADRLSKERKGGAA